MLLIAIAHVWQRRTYARGLRRRFPTQLRIKAACRRRRWRSEGGRFGFGVIWHIKPRGGKHFARNSPRKANERVFWQKKSGLEIGESQIYCW